MGRFSALLIGASAYDEAPLGFVLRDLKKLREALQRRGVRVELPRPPAGWPVTANFVNGEVVGFLARAEPGERLLIGLSGHGTHVDGQDYLVPEDIHPEQRPLWKGCIAIDWKQELQETRAAQVLFLVDACRQGIRDAMGPPVGWSPSKMRAVASRKVARLYACAPGELARFVASGESTAQAGDGSFSLFSRAVREVLVSHEGPLNLDELRAGVQQRVSALHREYRKAAEWPGGWPGRGAGGAAVLTQPPDAVAGWRSCGDPGTGAFPPLRWRSTGRRPWWRRGPIARLPSSSPCRG
ncbi:caspase domain-containing protein [Streptomyces sp. Y1]|uniref:Caspase domain-containing protein n=1 Tax=Streptomyces sp. Y1 TaxID=3238634 RepID=A0AB39TSV1_9ACTN